MTKREQICTTQVRQPQWGRPLTRHPSKHTEDEFVCASWSVFRLFTGESGHRAHLERSSAQHATVINHYSLCKTELYKWMLHGHYSTDPRSIKWTFFITGLSTAYELIKKNSSIYCPSIYPAFPAKRPHRVIRDVAVIADVLFTLKSRGCWFIGPVRERSEVW